MKNRPDVDSKSIGPSSRGDESKNDGEVEEWKSKFEEISKKHKTLKHDYESHKRVCESQIEEL